MKERRNEGTKKRITIRTTTQTKQIEKKIATKAIKILNAYGTRRESKNEQKKKKNMF